MSKKSDFRLFEPQIRRGPRVQLECLEESLTIQELANDVEPSKIMARFMATGIIDQSMIKAKEFMDCTATPDSLEGVYEVLRSATESYESMPQAVRDRFGALDNFIRETSTSAGLKALAAILPRESTEREASVDSSSRSEQGAPTGANVSETRSVVDAKGSK